MDRRRAIVTLATISIGAATAKRALAAGQAGARAAAGATELAAVAAGAGHLVVFMVRHAEKAAAPPRDPPLSEAGVARAQALADLLADAAPTHLFASEFARTQQTLAPLAQRCGREVEVVRAGELAALAKRLRALPGGSLAVVAGHSNTVPALVRALGGTLDGTETTPAGEQLPDAEYGRLMQLVLAAAGETGADAAAGEAGAAARGALLSLRLHAGAR